MLAAMGLRIAFAYCCDLVDSGVTSIESSAFKGSPDLNCIYFSGVREPEFGSNVFSSISASYTMVLDTYEGDSFGTLGIEIGFHECTSNDDTNLIIVILIPCMVVFVNLPVVITFTCKIRQQKREETQKQQCEQNGDIVLVCLETPYYAKFKAMFDQQYQKQMGNEPLYCENP